MVLVKSSIQMSHVDFHDGRHVVGLGTWGEPVVNTIPGPFILSCMTNDWEQANNSSAPGEEWVGTIVTIIRLGGILEYDLYFFLLQSPDLPPFSEN